MQTSLARRTIRWTYAPALWIGVDGAALAALGSGSGIVWLGPLLLVAVALSFLAERIAPWSPEWNRSLGDGARDVIHAVVNESASLAALGMLPILVVGLGTGSLWPSGLPFVVEVVGAILVLDLGVGFVHFLSHRLAWLWRIHAVHHSVLRMYGLNGLMKHPLHQAVETLAGTAPLVALGLPADVGTALVFCTAIQLLLQHSNVDYRLGPLRRWLAVAEVHRFHHRRSPVDGDVNFGLFTTLVDHALGTYYWQPEAPRSGKALGIAAEPDYPIGYAAQLVRPFRPRIGGSSAVRRRGRGGGEQARSGADR